MRFLAPLRPTGAFSVVERHGRATIAPDSYARYDAMADVIAALDPATVVRVYQMLAPRLEEAHGELGEGERTFDAALRESLRRLSETPIPEGPVAVTARGGVYGFADPRLEALSPAQKLLLRSGPDNARRVQTQLAAIAAALGAPPDTPAIADALGALGLLRPHFDAADKARDDVVEPRHEERHHGAKPPYNRGSRITAPTPNTAPSSADSSPARRAETGTQQRQPPRRTRRR